MGLGELLILAVGLSMDAFAVSICKGLSIQKLRAGHAVIVGAWFGAFQALMPVLGWLLGSAFAELIVSVDHWIAFALLCLIGGGMIREALGKEDEDCDPSLAPAVMVLLAVATSIDALAVGITFAVLKVDVLPAVALIGACTFAISAARGTRRRRSCWAAWCWCSSAERFCWSIWSSYDGKQPPSCVDGGCFLR